MYAIPYVLLTYMHQAAINARRRDRTWRYLGWSAVAGAFAGIMFVDRHRVRVGPRHARRLVVDGDHHGRAARRAAGRERARAPRHRAARAGCVRRTSLGSLFSRSAARTRRPYALCCAAWAVSRRSTRGPAEVSPGSIQRSATAARAARRCRGRRHRCSSPPVAATAETTAACCCRARPRTSSSITPPGARARG